MRSQDISIWRISRLNSSGFVRHTVALAILVFGIVVFHAIGSHALAPATQTIRSGVKGYCLDVHHDGNADGTVVDGWNCNNSAAQAWNVSSTTIAHNQDCLTASSDTTAPVVLTKCSNAASQVWLRSATGYLNPDSGKCLSVASAAEPAAPAILAPCKASIDQTWTAKSQSGSTVVQPQCPTDNEGQRVACIAAAEWAKWQGSNPGHNTLLNRYTDGAPYEEWCADFVSYVYKQAGYSFTGGETDGWDENIAGNIQYQGFVKHDAANYTPRTGDVAYFNYPGGHVEIVVSGGPHPTFIYGNSAAKDPISGNGNMAANTITSDGSRGQVVYYLSPR